MHMQQDEVQQFIDIQQNKNILKMKKEVREMQHIFHEELDTLFTSFIPTIRQKDGYEYEPSSLRSIDRKLLRHIYETAL